jgi:hypothetical protein
MSDIVIFIVLAIIPNVAFKEPFVGVPTPVLTLIRRIRIRQVTCRFHSSHFFPAITMHVQTERMQNRCSRMYHTVICGRILILPLGRQRSCHCSHHKNDNHKFLHFTAGGHQAKILEIRTFSYCNTSGASEILFRKSFCAEQLQIIEIITDAAIITN